MKLGLLLFISIFGFSFFQNGCGNANSSNQSATNNQTITVASASPSPLSSVTPSANQNTINDGATYEEARPFIELQERCKHAPVGGAKVTPITGTAPLKVTFDGSKSYDPDGTKIVKWQWHFGNRESDEGKTVTYTYEKPGKYGIGLNVTDSQGQKTSDCSDLGTGIEITVTDNTNTNTKLQERN